MELKTDKRYRIAAVAAESKGRRVGVCIKRVRLAEAMTSGRG